MDRVFTEVFSLVHDALLGIAAVEAVPHGLEHRSRGEPPVRDPQAGCPVEDRPVDRVGEHELEETIDVTAHPHSLSHTTDRLRG